MKLYIDTSSRDEILISLDGKEFKENATQEKSQRLLPLIKKTLEGEGKNLSDISEIEVFTGPGSFTGLRVGVSVANALGYSLGVPVNGKKAGSTAIKYSD